MYLLMGFITTSKVADILLYVEFNNLILQWASQFNVCVVNIIYPITLSTLFSISVGANCRNKQSGNQIDTISTSEMKAWFGGGAYGDYYIMVVGI